MPSKTFDIRNYVYLDLMTEKCVGHSYSQHLHHRDLRHYFPVALDFKMVTILS